MKEKKGQDKPPIGEYTFGKLMGIAPDPGTIMPYHQITEDDYWCGEQYYNEFVDEKTMDHSHCTKENDEHLIDYAKPYEYTAFFNYNKEKDQEINKYEKSSDTWVSRCGEKYICKKTQRQNRTSIVLS